jgi:hypothetical protein
VLKSKKLIPNIAQYFNWSMPSKHGFIGLIIGFISLLFAVTTFIYSHEESDKKIVNKIEVTNTNRDWSTMATLLENIKNDNSFDDLYNLMYGRLVIYNPTVSPHGPEKYLLNVSSESDYFRRSLKSLMYFYFSTKQASEIEPFLNQLASHSEGKDVYYYLIKYIILENSGYAELNSEYTKLLSAHSNLIDFCNYPFVVYSGNNGVARLDWAFDVEALVFIYNGILAIKARNDGLEGQHTQHLNNFMSMVNGTTGKFNCGLISKKYSNNSTKLVLSNSVSKINYLVASLGFKRLVPNLVEAVNTSSRMHNKALKRN